MQPRRWRNLPGTFFPGIDTIDQELASSQLPELAGDPVYVATDIGGEHKGSGHTVYTALFASLPGSFEWEVRRRRVRSRFMADGRRMAFKRLNDNMRRRALEPFLDAAGWIDGLVLSLAFEKGFHPFLGPMEGHETWRSHLGLQENWPPKKLDRLLVSANLVSLMIGGLGGQGQDIYWISDQDALFANDAYTQDVRRAMGAIGALYVQHEPGELGIGTTALDPGDRVEEDLASVADLVAAALGEIISKEAHEKGERVWVPGDLSWKSTEIGYWLSGALPKLRVATFAYRKAQQGFWVRRLNLRLPRIVLP